MVATTVIAALLSLLLLSPAGKEARRYDVVPSPPGRLAAAPPNEPAQVRVERGTIRIRYHGANIFEGRVAGGAAGGIRVSTSRAGGRIDQVVAIFGQAGTPVQIAGTVTTSDEGFPCEADRPLRARPIVRHVVGLSRSPLNQGVYDRAWDWLLSVDDQPRTRTRVLPLGTDGAAAPAGRRFSLESSGGEVVLRFRPRFFQQHRGLRYFEPWTYRVWDKPIVGWCSWFAFLDKVTEQDIRRTADVLADTLRPYGYEYLQLDDGYQRDNGLPELWLTTNDRFPGGLAALAAYIRDKGLTPAIWTNTAFNQTGYAKQHAAWFVKDGTGGVARGNWIGHPVDASVPAAVDTLVRPIYRGLRSMGWQYYKLDALRHLRYEGYNTFRASLERKGVRPSDALRTYVKSVRQEIGADRFLLACWGVRPELVGVVDGCRIGTDGFSYAGLAQYNSFNNIVWRNDPDHIELSEREAWRSTMVTSLTGSLFLLTDKPETYLTPVVEPARRAAPVPMTLPGQLYDVDPSRSAALWRVEGEVSGRDPKPFDASLTPSVFLYQLEVNKPFESWTVLGRTGGPSDEIRFEDLGLDPKRPYLVFEFWQRQLVGEFAGSFAPGPLPAPFNSQVFVIREKLDRPQLVATGRHITGGEADLLDVSWKDRVLAGRSRPVAGEPYEIYLTEPAGWTLDAVQCGATAQATVTRKDGLAKATCPVGDAAPFRWEARY